MEQTNNPLELGIKHLINHRLETLYTALPGFVTSYDPTDQTATIQCSVGYPDPLPLIVRVPVQQIGGANWMIDVQIEEGDEGLVVFSKMSLEDWLDTGVFEMDDNTPEFSLTDALFIPGLRSKRTAYSADNVGITMRNADKSLFLSLTDDGIAIEGDVKITGEVLVVGDVKAGTEASSVSLFNHVHGNPGTPPVPTGA